MRDFRWNRNAEAVSETSLLRSEYMESKGEVSLEVRGRSYFADYDVSGRVLTLRAFDIGSTSTQLGGLPAPTLARMLLRELVAAELNERDIQAS